MIISDLCDEYAVLVSQNKAPVYGYDNKNRRKEVAPHKGSVD